MIRGRQPCCPFPLTPPQGAGDLKKRILLTKANLPAYNFLRHLRGRAPAQLQYILLKVRNHVCMLKR
jgi:hypothetical protein